MFQAESASPDVQVVAVIDPIMPLGYMVYCSGTTVSTSGSTTPTWCLSKKHKLLTVNDDRYKTTVPYLLKALAVPKGTLYAPTSGL